MYITTQDSTYSSLFRFFCLAEELKNNPTFEENRMSMTARATNINPRGYQFGFIYNELSNTKTIAHELCHGAYHLRHTFDEADYLAPEGTTDNLMDYAAATDRTFNHWQWQDIHQPKNVRFKWAQDEEGAEWTTDGHYYLFTYLGMLMGMDYEKAEELGRYAERPDTYVLSESDFTERDYILPNGKKLHLEAGQVVMGEDEIVAIPSEYKVGDMLENTTWSLGGYQQTNHALTGGFHGVELAATTYAIKNREALDLENDFGHYLIHRFGDCFAHFDIMYDVSTNINKYIDDRYIFCNVGDYVACENVTKHLGENQIIETQDHRYITTYSRTDLYDKIQNLILRPFGQNVDFCIDLISGNDAMRILVDYNYMRNDMKTYFNAVDMTNDVEYFVDVPLNKYIDAIDDYIANRFVFWGRSFYTSEGSWHPELNSIYYREGKYWYTYYPKELTKKIVMSVINGEDFSSTLSLEEIREGILRYLDDIPQNRYRMYGDDVNCTAFTLGHTSDEGLPDDILRRPQLFMAYVARSAELIEIITNKKIDSQKKEAAIKQFEKIINWGMEQCKEGTINDGSKLDGIFAFLISLKRASIYGKKTFSVPIKFLPSEISGIFTKAKYYYRNVKTTTFVQDAENEKAVLKKFIDTCVELSVEKYDINLIEGNASSLIFEINENNH